MCFSSCYFLYIKGNSLSLPTFSLIQSISVVLSKYCSFMYYDLHPMIIRRLPGSYTVASTYGSSRCCVGQGTRSKRLSEAYSVSHKNVLLPSGWSPNPHRYVVSENLSLSSSLVVSMVYISSPVVIRPLSTCVELPIYSFIRLLSSSLALFRG